jgi:hypothetical protein
VEERQQAKLGEEHYSNLFPRPLLTRNAVMHAKPKKIAMLLHGISRKRCVR